MSRFLRQLELDPCVTALTDSRAFSNPELRLRGQTHTEWFLARGAISGGDLKPILSEANISVEAFARLLPYVAALMVAAVAKRLEAPLAALRQQDRKRTPVGLATERLSGFASFFRTRVAPDERDKATGDGFAPVLH